MREEFNVQKSAYHLFTVARSGLPDGAAGLALLRETADTHPTAAPHERCDQRRAAIWYNTIVRAACPHTWSSLQQQMQQPDANFSGIMQQAETVVKTADYDRIMGDRERGGAILRATRVPETGVATSRSRQRAAAFEQAMA